MTQTSRKRSKQKTQCRVNQMSKISFDKQKMEHDFSKCESSSEFVKFAKKYGATIRLNNHYVIRHINGRISTLSCTHGKQTPLHKTKKEFREIYNLS